MGPRGMLPHGGHPASGATQPQSCMRYWRRVLGVDDEIARRAVSSLMDQTSSPASALSPLRHPVFRSMWIASTLSNLGGVIQSVGASWMMLSIAGSASMVALVQASVALPIVLLALVAG